MKFPLILFVKNLYICFQQHNIEPINFFVIILKNKVIFSFFIYIHQNYLSKIFTDDNHCFLNSNNRNKVYVIINRISYSSIMTTILFHQLLIISLKIVKYIRSKQIAQWKIKYTIIFNT